MWNRLGKPLSIAEEFFPVLRRIQNGIPLVEWLDVEAFDRRHTLGKGSLVILDAIIPAVASTKSPTYLERRQIIYDQFIAKGIAESWGFHAFEPPPNKLLSFAFTYARADDQYAEMKAMGIPAHNMNVDAELFPEAGWKRLQEINKELGQPVFEGLVAKRVDSAYPIQLRNPELEFPAWVKARFDL